MAQWKKHRACYRSWHPTFLALLPSIWRTSRMAFRHLKGDEYDEAMQEVSVQAFVNFVSLMQRSRPGSVYPTVLARFAIRRVRAGRTVGGRLNSRDVLSSYAQRRRQFTVGYFDSTNGSKPRWLDSIVENHRTPVPDQVCFRIDYPAWLSQLSLRQRRFAECLADGNSTSVVARRFNVSSARVSQIRVELQKSWQEFQSCQ